jgi:hypothetical protein
MDEHGIEQPAPLVSDLGKRRARLIGGHDHQLARETACGEQPGSCGLGSTWYEQKAVPMMLFGVTAYPFRLTSGVAGNVHEADH